MPSKKRCGSSRAPDAATSFASGMAAISNTLFTLLSPGDRVVSVKDTYGGTNKLFTEFLPRFQVEVALCDTTDHDAIEAAIARGCRVLYLETPTNPTLKVVDIARLAAAGQPPARSWWPTTRSPRRSIRTLFSSARTWCCTARPSSSAATPMRWAAWSAAIRGWSGRSTITARSPARCSIRWRPICCCAGMKTLHLRIRQQNANALRIATLPGSPPHGGGGLLPRPGVPRASRRGPAADARLRRGAQLHAPGRLRRGRAVLPRLRYAHRAANLGAVETIVGTPATTSHVECTAAEREAMGIPEGLIRYSVGIEDADDLIADLTQALAPLR